jgi:His-Xaa-Ser system radical SAM maturase HxsC
MLKLYAYCNRQWDADPFVVRITTNYARPMLLRSQEALILPDVQKDIPENFRLYICREKNIYNTRFKGQNLVLLNIPKDLEYLDEGDIVRISPRKGHILVLYRRNSSSNTILLTERCNCNCIMCPQPPRETKDSFWGQVWLEAIPLISPETLQLGISGGEPTMAPENLLKIILACKNFLPKTALHILSNGRFFNYMSFCQDIAKIGHPNAVFGIPIYSDLSYLHDFIVQSKGAFDQTIRGIMNLKRCNQRIEIRTVLLQQNIKRLPYLARFIDRNLPYVDHIAIMGIEPIGYAKANLDMLWVDPLDYQLLLKQAIDELSTHHIEVSIYNHQLCVLDKDLWGFACKSISDWKNEYLEVCNNCGVHENCGGFFSSSKIRHSVGINPIIN